MTPSRGEIVAEGTWQYGDTFPCCLAIVRRDTWNGTGDHLDPPEMAGDRQMPTYEVAYFAPGDPGQEVAGGGQYSTEADTRLAVSRACGPSLAWRGEA